MWTSTREVAAGDVIIVWLTRDVIQPLVVTPGKDFNSRFGYYHHSDFVGILYGSKVRSRNGRGFIHVLRPTPELWTMALPHRTQILYLADIAFITSYLNIKAGSIIVEAGTGSASFSHSVVRTIGPTGHLWSYEFHEARATKAREEFLQHGMADTVTLIHRNVCKDGFTIVDTADAVFLDLPAPWDAIEHAKEALRRDRVARISCFSPCMEQVLRTVGALNEAGFTEIATYETLLRPHEVNQTPSLQSVEAVGEKLKRSEQKREEKRLRQIASSRLHKRKRSGDMDVHTELDDTKRIKTQVSPNEVEFDSADLQCTAVQPLPLTASPPPPRAKVTVSRSLPEVRGHTSYLTFACLLPIYTSTHTLPFPKAMQQSDPVQSSLHTNKIN